MVVSAAGSNPPPVGLEAELAVVAGFFERAGGGRVRLFAGLADPLEGREAEVFAGLPGPVCDALEVILLRRDPGPTAAVGGGVAAGLVGVWRWSFCAPRSCQNREPASTCSKPTPSPTYGGQLAGLTSARAPVAQAIATTERARR
jgi:hypothetical protein